MALRSCSPRCSSSSWFFLLLLLNLGWIHAAAAAAAPSLGKSCPSLDACRGGVPNLGCCKAINDGISAGDCSCVCKQLKIYNHDHLAQDCNGRWCLRCGMCRCAKGMDGPYSY